MRKYIVTIFDDEPKPSKEEKREQKRQLFIQKAEEMGFVIDKENNTISYNGIDFDLKTVYIGWVSKTRGLQFYINNANEQIAKKEKDKKLEIETNKLKSKLKPFGIDIDKSWLTSDGTIGAYIIVDGETVITFYFNGNIEGFHFHDKHFTDISELRKYIAEYKKQKSIEKANWEQKEQEYEKSYNSFWNQSLETILKNIKNNLDMLSDNSLTEGKYVGGYAGQSMSNSAWYSEEHGSLPKTKWTKQKILDIIANNTKELNFILPTLRRLPFDTLKEICLYEDGWHHTGLAYAETPFYSVDSPRNIVENLIERGII